MKQTKLGLMGLDALCAGVLALGAAMVLLPAFGLQADWALLAVADLLLLALCALCGRRPWVPLVTAAGVATVGFGLAALLRRPPEAVLLVIGYYARWAIGETAGGTPQLPVYMVCILPLVLVFWILARYCGRRKLLPLWTVTLCTAALITYKAVWMPEGWLAPFMLLCAGMILYLPRAALGKEGRLQAQLLTAVLAVPVLGLTLLLGPKENGEWRSAAIGYLVQDVQDFWEFHWGELPPLPVTSMRSMGLQPETDRLGGDIELGDASVIISDRPLLLRGQTLDVYTGSGWEDSEEGQGDFKNGNFRFNSLFWQGRRRDAFGLTAPPPVSKPLLDELLTETTATLRTQRNFRSLFLPYRTEKVTVVRGGGELYFDMQGEAYWDAQLGTSVEYQVQARTWNYRDEDFDRNVLLLENDLKAYGPDPQYDQAAAQGLQLPEELPEWVRALAGELTEGCGSPYEKAVSLRDYLSETCEYTLTPGPAGQEDFVAAFLTDRKGYCTYYASALTVLCRCAGIPARYVTGYGMVQDGKRYLATQGTAHAWTEIYLAHMGWIPLDALSQDIFERDEPEALPAGDALQGPPVTPSPTPDAGEGELWVVEPEKKSWNPIILLWTLPVVLAMGWALGRKLFRARRYTTEYVQRRFPDTTQAAEHCYAGLLWLLRLNGLRPQEGETLLAFWQRVGACPANLDWQEIGRIMDRLRFGEKPSEKEEIAFLCGTYRKLAAYTRKRMGIRGWFI